jgi:signal transduction histidine kinase
MAALAFLLTAIALRLIAAFLALRLIPISRGRFAWILIAVGLVLSSGQLIVDLELYLLEGFSLSLLEESLNLAVSIFLLLGMFYIRSLFEDFQAALVERERLAAEREDYLHMISHDLRAPLTVILGYAQILEVRFQEDASTGPTVQAIRQGAERMNAMIQDLTDFARLEGGSLALFPKTIELRTFLAHLQLVEGRERLRIDLPPQLPAVSADPNRLERIFINLLSNALKYSPPDTTVQLTARQQGHEIVIGITDQGPGLPAELLPRIFGRFQTGEIRHPESVGLGLYITRKLVEAQGGRIWVDSHPGEGSTFFFTLPTAGAN